MMQKLFPWRFLLKLAAKRFNVIDPLSVAARIRSFAQPSEVQEPIELLRAGIIFHARGLINTKAIQHNLDWVWPYWVTRQFNPKDRSFIPRAFSFSHINLTHRNWTAVGLPDIPLYPIIDPRGLLTPLYDGWSIDCWFYEDEGEVLCPSRMNNAQQYLFDDESRRVITEVTTEAVRLRTEASMVVNRDKPVVRFKAEIDAACNGWFIFALRPYNPEGIQFIEAASLLDDSPGWLVNKKTRVELAEGPEKFLFSDYPSGDVFYQLTEPGNHTQIECSIGMITSAALYRVESDGGKKEFSLSVPLELPPETEAAALSRTWPAAESDCARLEVPDPHIKFLYDAAVRTLLHLSAGEVIPGPYTYNRFWFRDACLMLNSMLTIGMDKRCRRHLEKFPAQQTLDGYFHSQDGEWDSNGQVLWLFNRYRLLSGGDFNPDWNDSLIKGANWIRDKRVTTTDNPKIRGLLPAGFSAEHFGPNDNYYWDDFWALAGLYGAAACLNAAGDDEAVNRIQLTAEEMERDIERSIALVNNERANPAIPTSPNRRLDSGAIGSLVADFPLQFYEPGEERILATAGFLYNNCLQKGCFFQDMIHSGINIYMTLELAQVYLRAEDMRFRQLLFAAAEAASPTGQWPEAIHPHTGGGCMGDGQHGWAAAEWLLMLRNMFVMEEKDGLVIGRGILPEWLKMNRRLSFGPTHTPFGPVRVEILPDNGKISVRLAGEWYNRPPAKIELRMPQHQPVEIEPPDYSCTIVSTL